jgi:hypothetical protein
VEGDQQDLLAGGIGFQQAVKPGAQRHGDDSRREVRWQDRAPLLQPGDNLRLFDDFGGDEGRGGGVAIEGRRSGVHRAPVEITIGVAGEVQRVGRERLAVGQPQAQTVLLIVTGRSLQLPAQRVRGECHRCAGRRGHEAAGQRMHQQGVQPGAHPRLAGAQGRAGGVAEVLLEQRQQREHRGRHVERGQRRRILETETLGQILPGVPPGRFRAGPRFDDQGVGADAHADFEGFEHVARDVSLPGGSADREDVAESFLPARDGLASLAAVEVAPDCAGVGDRPQKLRHRETGTLEVVRDVLPELHRVRRRFGPPAHHRGMVEPARRLRGGEAEPAELLRLHDAVLPEAVEDLGNPAEQRTLLGRQRPAELLRQDGLPVLAEVPGAAGGDEAADRGIDLLQPAQGGGGAVLAAARERAGAGVGPAFAVSRELDGVAPRAQHLGAEDCIREAHDTEYAPAPQVGLAAGAGKRVEPIQVPSQRLGGAGRVNGGRGHDGREARAAPRGQVAAEPPVFSPGWFWRGEGRPVSTPSRRGDGTAAPR